MAERGYTGKAGQLVVMAEFLLRGYNVAMPEVDVSDDVFVVHDRKGTLWRVQVKTAIGERHGYGFSGKFAVTRAQLRTRKTPDLFLVFALRADDRWEFLIFPRGQLSWAHRRHRLASAAGSNLIFTFRFSPTQVLCGARDFQAHRNNWDEWPVMPTP